MGDWQELVEYIHDPEVQAAVERHGEPEEEEPQPQQLEMWEE